MMINATMPEEVNLINWRLSNDKIEDLYKHLVASNFQDMMSLTRRIGDLENKSNKIKYRAQCIGGMIGIAAGALGGPLGSVIGFGIGRSVGNFLGNGMARKYYGEEQAVVNEHLFLANQRDSQLKFQMGQFDAVSGLVSTMQSNKVQDDKKIIQDMMVL